MLAAPNAEIRKLKREVGCVVAVALAALKGSEETDFVCVLKGAYVIRLVVRKMEETFVSFAEINPIA